MKSCVSIEHDNYVIVEVVPDLDLIPEVTIPVVPCIGFSVLFAENGSLLRVSSLGAYGWICPCLTHTVSSAESDASIVLCSENEIAPAAESVTILSTGNDAGAPRSCGGAQCASRLPG